MVGLPLGDPVEEALGLGGLAKPDEGLGQSQKQPALFFERKLTRSSGQALQGQWRRLPLLLRPVPAAGQAQLDPVAQFLFGAVEDR